MKDILGVEIQKGCIIFDTISKKKGIVMDIIYSEIHVVFDRSIKEINANPEIPRSIIYEDSLQYVVVLKTVEDTVVLLAALEEFSDSLLNSEYYNDLKALAEFYSCIIDGADMSNYELISKLFYIYQEPKWKSLF